MTTATLIFLFNSSLREKQNVEVLLTAVYVVAARVIKPLGTVKTVRLSLPGIPKGCSCPFNYTLWGPQFIRQHLVEISTQTCTKTQH